MDDYLPIRVVVVEDCTSFLSEILGSLKSVPKLELTGTAGNSEDAISLLSGALPDLLILDLFLERGTGIDVLKYLQSRQGKKTVTVVMTSSPSSQLEHYCLALGASQFRDKTEGFDWIPELANRMTTDIERAC